MKKYATPNITIRIFNNAVETTASDPTVQQDYVKALDSIQADNKTRVQLGKMERITKFAF